MINLEYIEEKFAKYFKNLVGLYLNQIKWKSVGILLKDRYFGMN